VSGQGENHRYSVQLSEARWIVDYRRWPATGSPQVPLPISHAAELADAPHAKCRDQKPFDYWDLSSAGRLMACSVRRRVGRMKPVCARARFFPWRVLYPRTPDVVRLGARQKTVA